MWESVLVLLAVVLVFAIVSFLVGFLVLVFCAKMEVMLSEKDREIDELEN